MAASRIKTVTAVLLVLQYAQQVDQDCADVEEEICLLYCMVVAMCGMTAAMTNMHGYCRILGVPHIHNHGQYETAKQMMLSTEEGGNPEQFRRKFRMYPETFHWLSDTLWDRVHVKRRRFTHVVGALHRKQCLKGAFCRPLISSHQVGHTQICLSPGV